MYKVKPFTVEAFQWTGDKEAIPDWAKKRLDLVNNNRHLVASTAKGPEFVSKNEWAALYSSGEIKVYSNEDFMELFEEVVDISSEKQ